MTSPAAELKEKALNYLRARGTRAAPPVIHERVAAAFAALDEVLESAPATAAGTEAIPGEWTVQEVVDHLVETHRPGLDELRCLLAGRRPPGPPIPAGLQSKAPRLRPWPWLLAELRRVHGDIVQVLERVPVDFETDARAPLVMVVSVPRADGTTEPLHWVEELDWRAYAIVWRLHVLDHLNQIKTLLAAMGHGAP
jgi:hypothetical protein